MSPFGDASVNHAAAGGAEQRCAPRAPRAAAATSLRLRGQPARDQRRSPEGWVESALCAPALRYAAASKATTPKSPSGRPRTSSTASARSAGPAFSTCARSALPRPRRRRRRDGVQDAAGDPRRLGCRPAARDRALAGGRRQRTGEGLAEDYLAERERVLAAARDAAHLQLEVGRGRHAPPRRGRRSRPASAAGGEEAVTLAAINLALADGLDAIPGASLRRGRCRQGRRLRRHTGPAAALRCGPRLRHAARRDLDPRPRPWLRRRRLPAVPEIQYLAYLHNAEDQLRGEAATMQFFSRGGTGTGWWSGSPATATRRASAGTSTTTTPSVSCATSPGS